MFFRWIFAKRRALLRTANWVRIVRVVEYHGEFICWHLGSLHLLLEDGKVNGSCYVFQWAPLSGWKGSEFTHTITASEFKWNGISLSRPA